MTSYPSYQCFWSIGLANSSSSGFIKRAASLSKICGCPCVSVSCELRLKHKGIHLTRDSSFMGFQRQYHVFEAIPCVANLLQNEVSGYQFNCCLPSMRSVFSGVIDPKPNLNCENKSFLEKKLVFRVLLTKPINLLRIA